MEDINKRNHEERGCERFVLLLFSVYDIGMIFSSVRMQWEAWMTFSLVIILVLAWFVFLGKYRDYKFRAAFITILIQISINLYAIFEEDLSKTLFILIALAVLTCLYGITDIIKISLISTTLLFFYRGVIMQSMGVMRFEYALEMLLQMGQVLVIELLLWFWVKKREQSSHQIMETIDVLKEAERSKDDFLANISHEIRTPINTICGMSEMVLREENVQNIHEKVFDIQTAGRNLMSVVSDILDFSELQSGKVEIVEEAYNITSTINDVINMTMARKNEKNIELIVDCDSHMPCGLLGDEKKLRRVIMNLVNNAIKFTEEGCVSIIIEHRKEDYGINLSVTVKDTGIGMNEEDVENIFSSFNQVDTKRNRQNGGIGLGLAISKAIVLKMGGIITAKSKLGKGSVVKFVVPQKVLEEQPIINIQHKKKLNLAIYIDMEQFKMRVIRDEYSNTIRHMLEQQQVKNHICRNLAELKRREAFEHFSHIFISLVEYLEDSDYFDEVAERTNVIVIIDTYQEKYISNPKLLRIYKPFYILPIASMLNGRTEEASRKYAYQTEKFAAPEAHVLVVDDNAMNIRVIEGLLANYQMKVSTAYSGQEALEKIETMEYDFVFMDHMMPEMDGVETLHRIRNKVGSYYQKVPIIALTANAVAGTREMFLAEGFSDFVEKPLELSVLERVIKRNLPEKKLVFTKKQSKKEEKEEFKIGDLDVEKGIRYCGGKEKYLKILGLHSCSAKDTREKIERYYEQQNWKDYTIAVHAIKSSMLSIGAVPLSELAKQLEAAGKEENITYICAHHKEMIAEYNRVTRMLQENTTVNPKKEEATVKQSLPVLEDDLFEAQVTELEEAMYALDGQKMLAILSELQKYQYCGTSLEQALAPIRRKVEMSDYMSAVDAIVRVKKELKQNEKGDAESC